jgi:hypothetical protein
MRIVLAALVLLATVLTVVVAGSADAARHPRFTRCVASTDTQIGVGLAEFVGHCNGKKTKLRIYPFKVTGKVGGVVVDFKRTGVRFNGRIGKAHGMFVFRNHSITGSYARHRVHLTLRPTAIWGRIGSLRVGCTIRALAPLGERITCTGKQGGAGVLMPYMALLYAAP